MPRGAAPGEDRGAGRPKGSRNKSKDGVELALAAAVRALDPSKIDEMQPAEFLNFAWRELAKAEEARGAVAIAKEAAPYFTAKLTKGELSGPGGAALQVEKIRRIIVDPKTDVG